MFELSEDLRVISAFTKTINILTAVKTAMTVGIIVYCVFTGFKGVSLIKENNKEFISEAEIFVEPSEFFIFY